MRRRCLLSGLSQFPIVESRDALLGKSFAPTGHKTSAAIDALGHFIPRVALGQQQDQPRPSGIFGPIRSAIGSPRQLRKLRTRQRDRISHKHDYSV